MTDHWTNSEIVKIRSSWADVMALNYYKDNDFVDKVFTDLVEVSPESRALLEDKRVYAEQKDLFAEILKFSMLYLHKCRLLEECMSDFVSENPSLVIYGVTYLEPLGSVLIKALRRTLGDDRFKPDVEGLWVKLYIFIANSILLNENVSESDEDSVTETTAPLRLSATSYTTEKPSCSAVSAGGESKLEVISIDLGKNEKYRGFRRNSLAADGPTLSLVVPPTITSSALTASKLDHEPVLTPRSSRRNTAEMLQKLGLSGEGLSSPKRRTDAPFDPRRQPTHRRTPSERHIDINEHQRQNSFSSSLGSVSTVDDCFEDEINFSSPEEPKSSVFDTKSFGINGLAPIAEFEPGCLNDASSSTSSRYGPDDSAHEASSRASSLSLHNLDYKSSISSGSGHSGNEATFKSTNVHLESPQPNSYRYPYISKEYDSPYTNKSYLSSVPHFQADFGKRASSGFMKSSYVLKKEMGNGNDTSDCASISRSRSFARPTHSYARSVFSLPPDRSPSTEQTYSFTQPRPAFHVPLQLRAPSPKVELLPRSTTSQVLSTHGKTSEVRKGEPKKRESKKSETKHDSKIAPLMSIGTLAASINTQESKPKRNFMRRLQNKFRSSSLEKKMNAAASAIPSFGGASVTSTGLSSRLSSSDVRSKTATMSRADLFESQSTRDSFKSSVSFFRNKTLVEENKKEKQNKYYVKKVPYKTVYIRDLIQ